MTYKIHVCFPPCGPQDDRSASFAFLNGQGEAVSQFFITNGEVRAEATSDNLRDATITVMRRAALHKFQELEHPTTTRMTPDGPIENPTVVVV